MTGNINFYNRIHHLHNIVESDCKLSSLVTLFYVALVKNWIQKRVDREK
jgi:hypothetical protein